VQQISIFFCEDELSFFAKTRSLSEIPIVVRKIITDRITTI
jgi:hypothetical protein